MTTAARPTEGTPPGAVPGVQRGCGTREEGGVYIETGLSECGKPHEEFWADPPIPYEVDSKLGQTLVERDNGDGSSTFHIVDWVGASGYPYPTDILEEIAIFGLSRRISSKFPFEYLTRDSHIVLVHGRAVTSDPEEALEFTRESEPEEARLTRHCALADQGDPRHIGSGDEPCTRFWYYDAEDTAPDRVRERPSFEYCVATEDESELEMEPGIIASYPISRIATIEAEDGSHKAPDQRLSEVTKIPNVVQPE